MLVLMFGQLMGCGSLRELTDLTIAHGRKSKHLGFGNQPVNRQILSRANSLRDHRIFEEFSFYMVSIAQSKRITKEFELHGRFYAIDSTTIDLCMAVFRWAEFRSIKSGIRIHTQIDIVTEIPVFYRIINAYSFYRTRRNLKIPILRHPNYLLSDSDIKILDGELLVQC